MQFHLRDILRGTKLIDGLKKTSGCLPRAVVGVGVGGEGTFGGSDDVHCLDGGLPLSHLRFLHFIPNAFYIKKKPINEILSSC